MLMPNKFERKEARFSCATFFESRNFVTIDKTEKGGFILIEFPRSFRPLFTLLLPTQKVGYMWRYREKTFWFYSTLSSVVSMTDSLVSTTVAETINRKKYGPRVDWSFFFRDKRFDRGILNQLFFFTRKKKRREFHYYYSWGKIEIGIQQQQQWDKLCSSCLHHYSGRDSHAPLRTSFWVY